MDVGFFFLIFSFNKLVFGEKEGYIVGGDFVKNIKQFPHVAFLEMLTVINTIEGPAEAFFICGASVLNQFILITAAHCLDDVSQVTAYVGNINREHGKPFEVESYEQHRNWDSSIVQHDIALCKVRKPLLFGRTVKRVLVMKNPPRSRTAHLAGWGAVEEKEYTDTELLKHTIQKLWDHKQCKTVLSNIPKGTICGGESRARDFASKGDSGSGLLVRMKILVGLVSFKDVAVSRSLVVYTDVAYHYNWIAKASKRLRCSSYLN